MNDANKESGEMTFLEHLEELRWVLLKVVISLGAGFLVMMIFLPSMVDFLRWPLDFAMGSAEAAREILRTRSPMDVFTVMLQVVLLGGVCLSLPAVLYFASTFVAPGLTIREKAVLIPVLLVALVSFLGGAAFSFWMVLPVTMKASLYFNELLGLVPLWSPVDYYSLVVLVCVLFGLVFELPLAVSVLVYLEVIRIELLAENWRPVFVGILIAAAVLSPGGDPVTFLFFAFPLSALFVMSVVAGRFVERRRDGWKGRSPEDAS